ncbi:nuclear transport factor 2 family protein [Candidatus Uabimicrobium amorphum]|uniref:SnoaL-like domain-containing protein n=1 Tax=Uabimicrobium amorphum TaxID=2596890 RepID=A0A5S9IT12_UABAM|nr:nuclear transport factor 2 family protein [Candidatus Uabimicrobium amorphum]BBM87569.1 hypothetical protein UABAM_05981 [Candidatus Uabimicrobium amorphum]
MKFILIFYLFFAPILFANEDLKNDLHTFLDAWHHAAAVADEKKFFGSMDKDSIYIGTDATERWSKDVFQKWCQFAFARKSAWTFIPLERKLYFSESSKIVWFDETLDTWMGICRGSGVLERKNDRWKIKHYHLAVTIPNELITEFTDLVKQDPYLPVTNFDDTRNANKDLAYAILQAKKTAKKILIVVGEKQENKCDEFFSYTSGDSKIQDYLAKHYIVLCIRSAEKKLLRRFMTNIASPSWCIIDDNAQKIKTASHHDLTQKQQYDAQKIMSFLKVK